MYITLVMCRWITIPVAYFQTIQGLLKKAQQGKMIDQSEIPPLIAVNGGSSQNSGLFFLLPSFSLKNKKILFV